MAPTYTRDSALSTKDRHKLRKPVVEKMRRDRINTCIEQLKGLLEKEFQTQEPNAKLEKADVLEMTVSFLRQQLRSQSAAPHAARRHGYARCWKETLHFLSANSVEEAALPCHQHLHAAAQKTLGGSGSRDKRPASPLSSGQQLHHSSQGPEKQSPGAPKPVWRPW
ncbi:hypothetical protein CRUP_029372 [Coryphaenoides rupestris]|nr:hypothetical protein CRUP_029372 [Coryphaenoides rupestris]